MALATEIRKSVTDTTPLLAVVGATDLAVERVRDIDTAAIQAKVTNAVQLAPSHAVAAALEAAGRVESEYEALAARGKSVVERVRAQKTAQELLDQGKATLSRTKAAVTTGRRSLDETFAAARDTVTIARKQVVGTVMETTEAVEAGSKATRAAAKKTTATARKRAASTRAAAKGAVTSASKTAAKAAEAAEDAAETLGDAPEAAAE